MLLSSAVTHESSAGAFKLGEGSTREYLWLPRLHCLGRGLFFSIQSELNKVRPKKLWPQQVSGETSLQRKFRMVHEESLAKQTIAAVGFKRRTPAPLIFIVGSLTFAVHLADNLLIPKNSKDVTTKCHNGIRSFQLSNSAAAQPSRLRSTPPRCGQTP